MYLLSVLTCTYDCLCITGFFLLAVLHTTVLYFIDVLCTILCNESAFK